MKTVKVRIIWSPFILKENKINLIEIFKKNVRVI